MLTIDPTTDRSQLLDAFYGPADNDVLEHLVDGIHFRSIAKRELRVLGPGVIRLLDRHGIRVQGLAPGVRFSDVSAAITRTGGCDENPNTLAVFVWPDRRLYVKDPQPGVFSHECGHAVDFCRSVEAGVNPDEIYTQSQEAIAAKREPPPAPFHSERDEILRATIGKACNAVSPYGSTCRVESWAEAFRAYCGINDGTGLFASLSSAKLKAINRPLYLYILQTFIELNGRAFERARHQQA